MILNVKQPVALFALLLLLSSIVIAVIPTGQVSAVSAADWKKGRIIDDAIFYNKYSMSAIQIQQFLNAKVPTCDRNRASSNPSYQPPWTCLKEYQENTTTKENNIGRFNANGTPYNVPGGKSASQIIWDVAQEYGINPQVLIVMLQKEQGLITDNWPWKVQYQKAMGYACPDTAPCDTQYYGFYNQVSSAAWQLKRYIAYPNNYNFKAGVSRYIQYSPNAACGGSQVYLENAATAALYNYTPYQPNAGALANLYGTADCGAYGNRNFWRYFNDWFGSTYSGCAVPTTSAYGVFRLFNKNTGGNLLTTNGCEVQAAKDIGYTLDGQVFTASPAGVPVYRLEKNGKYLITSSNAEKDGAVARYGFRLEGVVFYGFNPVTDPSASPVYRLASQSGGYIYTISEQEKAKLASEGYRLEGVVYYAKANTGSAPISTYRLSHPNGVYLFTTSAAEKDIAVAYYGYRVEGVGFSAITQLTTNNLPVYRLAGNTGYVLTTSLSERVYATQIGYRDEGITMYAYNTSQTEANKKPLYRLSGRTGTYLYTASTQEINSAVNYYGYRLEGLAFRTP